MATHTLLKKYLSPSDRCPVGSGQHTSLDRESLDLEWVLQSVGVQAHGDLLHTWGNLESVIKTRKLGSWKQNEVAGFVLFSH